MLAITHYIGKAWMKFFGWKVEGEIPPNAKFVFIAAPHTSNWDLPFMLGTAWSLRADISWLGKHTLFDGKGPLGRPFAWWMKSLGGLPVDRRAPQGLVAQVVEMFKKADYLVLAVPPEGTRSKVEYWKSGFYHIALGAQVPIGLGYLDFENKVGGLGGFVMPTGDVKADMDKIRAFYADKRGKFPEFECVPRLREEDAPASGARASAPGAAREESGGRMDVEVVARRRAPA